MEKVKSYGHDVYSQEFVGQGVNFEFVKWNDERGLLIKTDIKDGNGEYMGRVEYSSKTGKAYVDVRIADSLKRKTLANLMKKIGEAFVVALQEEIAAEAEPNVPEDQSAQEEQEGAPGETE